MADLCADCILWAPSPVLCFRSYQTRCARFHTAKSLPYFLCLSSFLGNLLSHTGHPRMLASGANPTQTSWSDKIGCIAHWTTKFQGYNWYPAQDSEASSCCPGSVSLSSFIHLLHRLSVEKARWPPATPDSPPPTSTATVEGTDLF